MTDTAFITPCSFCGRPLADLRDREINAEPTVCALTSKGAFCVMMSGGPLPANPNALQPTDEERELLATLLATMVAAKPAVGWHEEPWEAMANGVFELVRDMVLEAAAKACDDEKVRTFTNEGAAGMARECAKRIRAMKGTP